MAMVHDALPLGGSASGLSATDASVTTAAGDGSAMRAKFHNVEVYLCWVSVGRQSRKFHFDPQSPQDVPRHGIAAPQQAPQRGLFTPPSLSRVIEHCRARHITWRDKLNAGTGQVDLAAADVVAMR